MAFLNVIAIFIFYTNRFNATAEAEQISYFG